MKLKYNQWSLVLFYFFWVTSVEATPDKTVLGKVAKGFSSEVVVFKKGVFKKAILKKNPSYYIVYYSATW